MEVIRKTFLLILQYSMALSLFAMLIYIGFNLIKLPGKEVGTQWWAALSIMCAFFISTLAVSFYKQSEVNEIKEEVRGLKNEIESYKALSTIPALLLAVYNDNVSSIETKWDTIFKKLKELHESGHYDSKSLISFSTLAFREGYSDVCFDLRKLAYESDKNNSNKVRLASVVPYIREDKLPKYLKNHRFLRFLNIDELDEDAYALSEKTKGRYYSQKNKKKEALVHFENTTKLNGSFWHCRDHLMALICLNDIAKLRKIKSGWEEDSYSSWVREPESGFERSGKLRVGIFKKFVDAFIEIYQNTGVTDDCDIFYKSFNPTNISEISISATYDVYPSYNVFVNLKDDLIYKPALHPNKSELINLYLTYYYFFGEKDHEAEEELSTKNGVEKIFKKITSFWF
jgi:hypothetical protein